MSVLIRTPPASTVVRRNESGNGTVTQTIIHANHRSGNGVLGDNVLVPEGNTNDIDCTRPHVARGGDARHGGDARRGVQFRKLEFERGGGTVVVFGAQRRLVLV